MTEHRIALWLVYPDSQRDAIGPARRTIQSACENRGWQFIERPTREIRVNGRPLNGVKVDDAISLYKLLHRARVGVWELKPSRVPTSKCPQNDKDYIALNQFVLHKAFVTRFQLLNFDYDWCHSLDEFMNWLRVSGCENEGDPRCLPFHLFATGIPLDDLENDIGRSRFADMHGPQSKRLDDRTLSWQRPLGVPHGRDALLVSGCQLVRGFHWDVSASRNRTTIKAHDGDWIIEPGGYLNVYPDAYIRTGRKARFIKLTEKRKAR